MPSKAFENIIISSISNSFRTTVHERPAETAFRTYVSKEIAAVK